MLLLDQLLSRTKVQLKHMQIIGVVCFLLAAKETVDAPMQPALRELCSHSNYAFTGLKIKEERKR